MKKLTKGIVALALAGVSLLSLSACTYGGNKAALAEMQAKIAALESDLSAEKAKTGELSKTVEEQNKNIAEQNKNIAEQSKSIAEQNKTIESLTTENATQNKTIQELTNANDNQASVIESMTEEMNGQNAKIEKLQTENDYISKTVDLINSDHALKEQVERKRAEALIASVGEDYSFLSKNEELTYGSDLEKYRTDRIVIEFDAKNFSKITKEYLAWYNVSKVSINEQGCYALIYLDINGIELAKGAVVYYRTLDLVKEASLVHLATAIIM